MKFFGVLAFLIMSVAFAQQKKSAADLMFEAIELAIGTNGAAGSREGYLTHLTCRWVQGSEKSGVCTFLNSAGRKKEIKGEKAKNIIIGVLGLPNSIKKKCVGKNCAFEQAANVSCRAASDGLQSTSCKVEVLLPKEASHGNSTPTDRPAAAGN